MTDMYPLQSTAVRIGFKRCSGGSSGTWHGKEMDLMRERGYLLWWVRLNLGTYRASAKQIMKTPALLEPVEAVGGNEGARKE